jgi:NAD(P)-dependent dehydrogenase (short-subunit alcohol dehydrogenase family)
MLYKPRCDTHPGLLGIVHRIAYIFKALIGTVEELSASTQTMNLVRDQFEINYFGPLNIIKAALPYMRRERSGHVMIISGISKTSNISKNKVLDLTIYSGAYRHTRTRNVLRSRLGP